MTTTPRRRRGTTLVAALLSAALVFAACGDDSDDSGPPAGNTRSVTADNGTVDVPTNPQRVAAIGNASLPFIDLGGKPVGVTEVRASNLALLPADQKATYDAATNLGPSGGEVDLEKLAGLTPDLILAQMPNSDFEQIQTQLEAIAPTVFFGLGAEWKTLADAFAEAGNKADTLQDQKAALEAQITKIHSTYGEIIDSTSFAALDRYASSDPATFVVTHIGCVEVAQDDVGLRLPEHEDGNNGETLSFEQIGELVTYDVLLYPVDASGQPTEPFAPVVETNAWKALPAVTSGHALGVFCPGNNSYGSVLRYLESLDGALATLPAK